MQNTAKKSSLSQALNRNVRHYGKSIVSNLAMAARTTQLFSPDHRNVIDALAELEEFISSFVRLEGEVSLSRVDNFLFLNEVPIRVDLGGVQNYQFILDVFKEREIGSIVFQEGVDSAELAKLVHVLNTEVENPEKPWEFFDLQFQVQSFENIQASRAVEEQEERIDFSEDRRTVIVNTFFRAVHVAEEVFDALRAGRRLNLKRLKRVVHSLVDIVLEDESLLLALVNIRDYRSRFANHAVNVTVLAIAIGARFGFPKKHLGDLGIAALLHDGGKVKLPEALHDSPPDRLSADQQETLRDHVFSGVEILLNQRIVDAIVKSMNVCFLHHFRFDATGYPKTQVVREQNLYSRIVAVADFYDNRSFQRAGGEAWPPDRTLRALLDGGGTEFDPLVVKAFVNIVGLYPVGCIVQLDTGELGTVVAPSTDPRYLDRPTVRVFADAQGNSVDQTVQLLDRDSASNFQRSVLKLTQQQEVQLELEEYLTVI